MKKLINTCFGTTKKAILSITCVAAATAAIGGAAYASTTTGTAANTTVIGEAKAQEYAFADANVDKADAKNITTEYEFEDGQYIYDVEFSTDDTEFEYWISADEGTIIKKSAGVIAGTVANTDAVETSAETADNSSDASAETTLDEAKSIALSDAGVASEDATFTKAKRDTDDGVAVYDIEFYTSTTEYEYEIRISDGAIADKSQEARKTSSGTSSGSTGTGSSSYISVDKAREIALNQAGLKASEVTFQKAMLDKEDGVTVYEIEFCKGATEYECTINATTGAILEYDVDTDDD